MHATSLQLEPFEAPWKRPAGAVTEISPLSQGPSARVSKAHAQTVSRSCHPDASANLLLIHSLQSNWDTVDSRELYSSARVTMRILSRTQALDTMLSLQVL